MTRFEHIAQLRANIASIKAQRRQVAGLGLLSIRDRRLTLAALRQRLSRLRGELAEWKRARTFERGPWRLVRAGKHVQLEPPPGTATGPSLLARAHGFRWSFRDAAYVSRRPDAWSQGCRLIDTIARTPWAR